MNATASVSGHPASEASELGKAFRCPNCGGTSFVNSFERGEEACTGCGLVVEERTIDSNPERRVFTLEERDRKSRTGPPLSPTIHTGASPPSSTGATRTQGATDSGTGGGSRR